LRKSLSARENRFRQIAKERGILSDSELDRPARARTHDRTATNEPQGIALVLTLAVVGSGLPSAQQKPAGQKPPRTPRLFAPQDLGLLEPPESRGMAEARPGDGRTAHR
jgi:hypothetical protein